MRCPHAPPPAYARVVSCELARACRSLAAEPRVPVLLFEEEAELHNKKTPQPCLWKAPASCTRQRPENQKETQAGHSSERTVEGQSCPPVWRSLLLSSHWELGLAVQVQEKKQLFYYIAAVEEIQRKSRVRGWTPQNARRIRAGVTKKDQTAELKKNQTRTGAMPKKNDIFLDDRQTPARREARNHRSEDAKMLGPPPCGPQRTGRADQRDVRGDANRDQSTKNHRLPVLLCATQRPRSTNNETTTTTRHPELRDPRPDPSDDRYRELARSLFERH